MRLGVGVAVGVVGAGGATTGLVTGPTATDSAWPYSQSSAPAVTRTVIDLPRSAAVRVYVESYEPWMNSPSRSQS